MSLVTAKYLSAPPETAEQFNSETGWLAVGRGLRQVAHGYVVLIAGTALGLALLRLGLADGPLVRTVAGSAEDRDALLLAALLTLGLTALLSYGLVLVGQWRCLMYAPQAQHAKELMYVGFNCVLLASLLNAAGAYLDGGRLFAALREGVDAVDRLDLGSAGTLMQLASGVLGLLGALVFSGFLRCVAGCFQDRGRARGVDLSLALMGLTLGGSVGALFCVQRLSFRAQAAPWLVAGWLLCFVAHLAAVAGVARLVAERVRFVGWAGATLRHDSGGHQTLRSLSGLHRLARGEGR